MPATLAACGFHPVYGVNGARSSPARRQLGMVEVAIIPERSGQLLRQALQQRVTSTTDAPAKEYQLSVSYSLAVDIIGTQQDSTATRVRYTGSATWSLRRFDPASTLVTNGYARFLDGINIIDQQYFESDLAGETVQRRMAETIANQITLQLAAYFARQQPAG